MKARMPAGYGRPDMNALMRQAQKMQDEITTLQEDIENREFSATSGGGAVEVVVTGKKTVKSITLKPEVVDPEDIEMLQDLIISAVNEAVNNVEQKTDDPAQTPVEGGETEVQTQPIVNTNKKNKNKNKNKQQGSSENITVDPEKVE